LADLPLANRRILVVDDQSSIRGLLHVALTEAGADVQTAASGADAIVMVGVSPPDLILLDLAMPGMTGWQVLETLKGSRKTASIPVVLETSAEDFASFDKARKLSVAAFVSKPFRLSEVVETCRRILGGARPLQGRAQPAPEESRVEVRDTADKVLSHGTLMDMATRGAQVDLERPLVVAQRVTLVVHEGPHEGSHHDAEVRWITQVDGRYQHGLRFVQG
jgi:CheY-like chemotaxis protein